MKIGLITQSHYVSSVSDYKAVLKKFVPTNSAVNFQGSTYEINTRRTPNEITKFVIDANIKTSPKISTVSEKKEESVVKKYDDNIALLRKAPILDRLDYVIEKLRRGEYVSASTMGALSIFYGPEDLREVGSVYKQMVAYLKKQGGVAEYDYKVAQHPFSFFRGSILHNKMNPFALKKVNPESLGSFAKWWHKTSVKIKRWFLDQDKALIDTNFGKFFMKKMKIEFEELDTRIEKVLQFGDKKRYVKAYKFVGKNEFGKLTARAMTRVPVLGTIADATIEVLEIRNDIKNGENFFESAAKAGLRYASSTVTTAYLGAIGSKIGPIGSLGGITVAAYINDKIEKAIDENLF